MAMASRPASRNGFKIAIFCALCLEAEAVQPIFDIIYDERNHSEYGKMPGDTNAYTLGRIDRYDVVLVYMPGTGKGIAASVASHTKLSYPGIELSFLVGICGGIPYVNGTKTDREPTDIFLGDVIISSGIVQYDFGQRLPSRFVHKDTLESNLGRASTEIRSFLSKMKSSKEKLMERLPSHLASSTQYLRSPYPGAENDVLFTENYKHKLKGCQCTKGSTTNDKTIIERHRTPDMQTPSPYLHFGRVASGDTVMKSAKHRDKIARRHGIIGFEMEGAGIWDNLPCILVKGVSDYADSHKSDEWQQYAAASAAACMRTLLEEMPIPIAPPLEVQSQAVATHSNPRKRPARALNSSLDEEEKAYLEYLNFPRSRYRFGEISDAHTKTCLWVMEGPDYQSWVNKDNLEHHGGLFWIKGKPGAGKSTLMKCLLKETKKKGNTITLSFFFWAQGFHLERSTIGMYRSLLYQLLTAKEIPAHARQDYFRIAAGMKMENDDVSWDVRDLKNLLSSTLRSLGNSEIVLFIDALDECAQDEIRDMINFLQHLGHSVNTSEVYLKTCLASRHYPNISVERGLELVLENQTEHEGDIRKYVQRRLRGGNSRVVQNIRDDICARAEGVFLWVFLVVESLNVAFDLGQIEGLRQRFNEIHDGLDNLFRDILTRDNKDRSDLIFCLQLVLFSQRPLSQEEFYFAMFFNKCRLMKRDPQLHTDTIIGKYILNVSKGLVEISRKKVEISSKKAHTVHFIHESVRDFLLRGDGFRQLRADFASNTIGISHDSIKTICYKYLHYIYRSVLPRLEKTLQYRSRRTSVMRRFPFFSYAVRHVLVHSNLAYATGISQSSFLEAFSQGFSMFKKAHNAIELYQIRQYKDNVTIPYILAEKSLNHLLRLASTGTDYDLEICGKFRGSMGAAVYNGNSTTILILLRCRISREASPEEFLLEPDVVNKMKHFLINIRRRYNRSTNRSMGAILMMYAVQQKHQNIINLLVLTQEINFSTPMKNGCTPIVWAIINNKLDTLKMLLGFKQVDVNDQGQIPLKAAIAYPEAFNMLLGVDSLDYGCQDDKGGNAVHWVLNWEGLDRLDKLISLGFDVRHRDKEGRDAFSHATEHLQVDNMDTLLKTGVIDVDVKDVNGRTPLSWLASCPPQGYGNLEDFNKRMKSGLSRLLRFGEVDVNSTDKDLMTPLLWAVTRGNIFAFEALVNIPSVDVDCRDLRGQTPLSIAAARHDTSMVKMLLETGRVGINSQDIHGRTPLSWAVGPWYPSHVFHDGDIKYYYIYEYNIDVIKQLCCSRGINMGLKDNYGNSPIWWGLALNILRKERLDVTTLEKLLQSSDAARYGSTNSSTNQVNKHDLQEKMKSLSLSDETLKFGYHGYSSNIWHKTDHENEPI